MKYSLVDFRIFHVIQMEGLQNFDKIETYITYFYFLIFLISFQRRLFSSILHSQVISKKFEC